MDSLCPLVESSAQTALDRLTLGSILRIFLPVLLPLLKLGKHKLRVLRHLAACGTPVLGANLFACPYCGHRHWAPRSCGDRHCPRCMAAKSWHWLQKQTRSLLPITYYHCVFTLPAELNSLVIANQRRLYPLLFECAAQSLLELGRNRLQGDLGITAVLHTWGQKLDFHPHLHCIVTSGALSADGKRWRSPKQRKFLFPLRALGALFRGKFLAGLRQMLEAAELSLPDSELNIPASRARWLSLLYTKRWVLYAKCPFGGPLQCRCRCAAPDRHLQLSRLPPRLTTQGLNPLGLGVHPALQFAYPAFGTGAYLALWNPRKQSQKTCNRTSARDLEASPARSGASAAERCPKTDVLSVVRKSRNSSGGLYRRCRPSAHDRPQPNAMRFLMKTLRARPTSRLLPAFRQNFLWIRSGCPTVFLSPAKPGSGYQGTDSRVTITTPGLLAPVQSRFSKLLLRQYTPRVPLCCY